MSKIILLYIRYLESAIYAGMGDDEIIDLFSLQFSITKSEIQQVRKQLYDDNEKKSMIEENIRRFENNELPFVNDKVAGSYKYISDFQTIISDFSSSKPLLERGRSSLLDLMKIFDNKELRRLVDCSAMLEEGWGGLSSNLSALGLEQIPQDVYDRYCYWFWDSDKYSQKDLANFVYNRRSEEQYRLYINPLIHNNADILRSFGKVSNFEIMRKNNLIFHNTERRIISDLDRGISPNAGDIALLFSVEKALRTYDELRPAPKNETNIDTKSNGLMQNDEVTLTNLSNILVVPHENLIKQMFYSGMQKEKIEMVLSQLGFNKIPKCWLDLIYSNCISDNEEAAVIEENRRRLPLRKELYESTTIRDKFIDGEAYETLREWFQGDYSIDTFPLKEILMQRDKRSLIENAVMSGMPFKRLDEAWLLQFKERLTIDIYRSFMFYCWNLPDGSRDGLYQYLVQELDTDKYKSHKQLLDKKPLEILNYFHLLNESEKREWEQLKWSRDNHLREEIIKRGVYLFPAWLIDSLELSLKSVMQSDKRVDKEHGRKQLERIFARIVGKERYHLTRSDIFAFNREWEERHTKLKIMEGKN